MTIKNILFYTTMFLLVMFFSQFSSTYYIEAQNQPVYTDEIVSDTTDPNDIPVSMEDFQDSLSQDGNFVTISPDEIDPDQNNSDDNQDVTDNNFDNDIYTNYIWVPNPQYLYDGWTPYCDGQWVWTDWGWMWVSNYRWGWYPYHYGRWWHSNAYGWVWSPGHRWAPGWVDWCSSGGYVGWHPISPREHYGHGGYENPHHDLAVDPGWVFVNKGNFTRTIDRTKIVDVKNNPEILKNSTPLTGITQSGKKVIDPGPNLKEIENATGKPITITRPNLHTDNFNKKSGNNNTNISKNNGNNTNINKNNNNTEIQNTEQKNTKVEKPKSSINKTTYSTSKSYNSTKTYNTTTSSGTENTKQTRSTSKTESTTKTGSYTPKPYVAPKQNPTPPPPKQNPPQKKK